MRKKRACPWGTSSAIMLLLWKCVLPFLIDSQPFLELAWCSRQEPLSTPQEEAKPTSTVLSLPSGEVELTRALTSSH